MRWLGGFLTAVVCIAVPLASVADDPVEPPLEQLDNGDYSWARQVIPVLYGRKPLGYSEIRLIADVAKAGDRRSTLLGLMSADEFVEHWTDVLMDHLRVNRIDPKSQDGCYSVTASEAGKTDALAKWIRDHPPTKDDPLNANRFEGPGADTFNMNDVLRSSLRLDDLSPVFLAHLFAYQNKPLDGNEITEANKRTDLWANFEAVYLQRKNECLLCHNSSFSVTGPESQWNRSHPIPGHFESYVYGGRKGLDPVRLRAFFRTDVLSGAIRPWGLNGCGSFAPPTKDDLEPPASDDALVRAPNDPLFAGMALPKGSVFDVEKKLREGFDTLRASQIVNREKDPLDKAYCALCEPCKKLSPEVVLNAEQQSARDAVTKVFEARCESCHVVGKQAPALSGIDLLDDVVRAPASKCMLVAPGDKNRSYLWQKVQPNVEGECSREPKRMPSEPSEPLNDAELGIIDKWIVGLPANAGCKTCKRLASRCDPVPELKVEPHEGFALMVASGVASRAWREALGYPLTISNYFARSDDQGALLRLLTETTFIGKKFSLKELLVHILVSPYFNRRLRDDAGKGYLAPLVADPWTEFDPRYPPVAKKGWTPGSKPERDPDYDEAAYPQNHKNAATETIRRFPAYTLLRAADTALGWFSGPGVWDGFALRGPELEYAKSAGLFVRDSEPGFRGIDLQSLLIWESRNGTCMRPDGVDKDWIDRVMEEAAKVNAATPQSPVTHRELAAALKDWFTGELAIAEEAEAPAVAQLLGWNQSSQTSAQAFLDAPAALGASLADGARKFCGVLLQSPQFQLAGMAPAELAPPPHDAAALEPRLRVCNGGPCRYKELCEALAPRLQEHGSPAMCPKSKDAPVLVAQASPAEANTAAELDAMCPPGLCYLQKLPAACQSDPVKCVGRFAFCDPRTDSCGGPQTAAGRLQALREGAVLVAELEGAQMADSASEIQWRRSTGEGASLARNTQLSAGDVLVVKPGQALTLQLSADAARSRTSAMRPAIGRRWTFQPAPPKRDAPAAEAQPLTVIVTGPTLRAQMATDTSARQPPAWSLGPEREIPWLRYGEAGQPLKSDPKASSRVDAKAMEERYRAVKAARDAAAR